MLHTHFFLTLTHVVQFFKLKHNYIVNSRTHFHLFFISLINFRLSLIFSFFSLNFFHHLHFKIFDFHFFSKDNFCKIQIKPQIHIIVTDLPSQTIYISFFYIDLLLCISQIRWEASTSCPQPLFYGVPRGLRAGISLSSCLRCTVKRSRCCIRN